MEEEIKHRSPFDMEAMRINLPGRKGGLSMYYAGRSRTFKCMGDVRCLDDLKKQDRPIIKGRKKQLDEITQQQMPSPCRPPSDTKLRSSPIVGL